MPTDRTSAGRQGITFHVDLLRRPPFRTTSRIWSWLGSARCTSNTPRRMIQSAGRNLRKSGCPACCRSGSSDKQELAVVRVAMIGSSPDSVDCPTASHDRYSGRTSLRAHLRDDRLHGRRHTGGQTDGRKNGIPHQPPTSNVYKHRIRSLRNFNNRREPVPSRVGLRNQKSIANLPHLSAKISRSFCNLPRAASEL